jgi:DNA-binding NtrC family response regulator
LNVATIHLPPLREHGEDIPLLANYFLEKYNCHLKKSVKGFADAAMALLQSYSYPGNVRELENLVERAVMLTPGEVILPDALREMFAPASPPPARLPIVSSVFSQARDYLLNLFEKQFVIELLTRHHGNVSAAARASQMSRQNFHRLLLKHNLQADSLVDDKSSVDSV